MKNSNEKTINYYSPHPVNECYLRIKNSLPKIPRYSLIPPETLVVGDVSTENFRLFKKIPAYNIFQTGLKASLKTHNGGTLIHGKMGLLPFVKYCFSLIFSLFIFFPLFTPFLGTKPTLFINILALAIILCLIFVFSFIFERLSWYHSRGESDFLRDFLVDLLDAEEV